MKKGHKDSIKKSARIGALAQSGLAAKKKAAATKKIGFVVSTRDQPYHLLAFLQALKDQGWGPTKAKVVWASADGRYGSARDELQNHAKKHIRRNNVDMIVAAGGLTTAIAVAKAIDAVGQPRLQFVYLIGRSPLAPETEAAAFFSSRHKAGGVDQNIPAQNERNFQQLKNQPGSTVTATSVGLVVNDNNAMTKPEVQQWTANGHQFVYQVQGNNEQQVPRLLQRIKQGPQPAGLVVSSDPYLRSVGPEFDMQLRAESGGGFAGWVCYPYQEYLDQDPTPSLRSIKSDFTPQLATDDPTDSKSAYYQLGIKAAKLLDELDKPGKKPDDELPDVGIVTWNGSDWGS